MQEKPNYIEDAVSIAVGSQIALLSFPFFKYSVVPISRRRERWLGADARLVGAKRFLPFYMQFKRPFAHTVPSRANIIKDRNRLSPKLSTAPRTLYFSLQRKLQHHSNLQHNILYRLRKKLLARGIGDAAYVCPLFLDRQTYFFHSHMTGLLSRIRHWPSRAYERQAVTVRSATGRSMVVPNLPLLSEHISVPPHATVSTAAHRYSFTERGDEVCFHSPEYLPEGSLVLSQWLAGLISNVAEDNLLSLADSRGQLQELVSETLVDGAQDFELPRNSSQAWFAWGDYLERKYSIEQYGIIVKEP